MGPGSRIVVDPRFTRLTTLQLNCSRSNISGRFKTAAAAALRGLKHVPAGPRSALGLGTGCITACPSPWRLSLITEGL